jgi:hypothetical protein
MKKVSDQLHALATLSPGTYRKGGWSVPRDGLDVFKKTEISSPCRKSILNILVVRTVVNSQYT